MTKSKFDENVIRAHALSSVGNTVENYIESVKTDIADLEESIKKLREEGTEEYDWRLESNLDSLKQYNFQLDYWKKIHTLLAKELTF